MTIDSSVSPKRFYQSLKEKSPLIPLSRRHPFVYLERCKIVRKDNDNDLVGSEETLSSAEFISRLISESENGVSEYLKARFENGRRLSHREADILATYLDLFRSFREGVKDSFEINHH
jgi:hypothetical protein